jgi:hypothetical protein
VLCELACSKRLTGPGAAAEDTESTAVFLYSKEKDCRIHRPCRLEHRLA